MERHMHHGMKEIVLNDANGVLLHAWSANAKNEAGETGVSAWAFPDKESGFGFTVGSITFVTNLRRNDDGTYGAA